MRKALPALVLAAALAAPAAARAGWFVEASLGDAWQVSDGARQPIILLVAPGATAFHGLLRFEVGVGASAGDVAGTQPDLVVRPMVALAPPGFPLYLKGIASFEQLANGPATWGMGGGAGASFTVMGVGMFVEVAALPHTVNEVSALSIEGRLGTFFEF